MNFKTIVLLLLSVVLIFTRCNNDDSNSTIPTLPIKFTSPYNNTSLKKGELLTVTIEIHNPSSIENISLKTKDTSIFEGATTKNTLSFSINTINWKVGATPLLLEAQLKDGKSRKDNRLVRILSNVYPTDYKATAVQVYKHNTKSYTQGLEFDGDVLIEGTGGMGLTGGESILAQVDLNTGNHLNKVTLAPEYFGEGITLFDGQIFQLTWQQNKCFVYDKNSLEKTNEFNFSGEGWGLCNDGEQLIQSDGTERLYFRNPKTFALENTLEVYNNDGPVRYLNELEYINGKIYANVYQTNNIVIIHPETGIVEGVIDASMIALEHKKGGEVLNGIAYHKERDKIYITGKNWPSLLEIELTEF